MKKILRATTVVAATLLASKAIALQVGDVAPGFKLQSTAGEVELSRVLEKGPVVLALYYADFTSG